MLLLIILNEERIFVMSEPKTLADYIRQDSLESLDVGSLVHWTNPHKGKKDHLELVINNRVVSNQLQLTLNSGVFEVTGIISSSNKIEDNNTKVFLISLDGVEGIALASELNIDSRFVPKIKSKLSMRP